MVPSLRRLRSLSARRTVGGLFAIAGAALLAFHGGLLWQRLADGSLLEPVVAGRWVGALLLAGWLVRLRRAGVSLWRGERARTFWVLVLLLHTVPALDGSAALAPDGRGLLLVLPAALVTGLLAAWLPRLGGRAFAAPLRRLPRLANAAVPALAPGLERSLAPRAPPA